MLLHVELADDVAQGPEVARSLAADRLHRPLPARQLLLDPGDLPAMEVEVGRLEVGGEVGGEGVDRLEPQPRLPGGNVDRGEEGVELLEVARRRHVHLGDAGGAGRLDEFRPAKIRGLRRKIVGGKLVVGLDRVAELDARPLDLGELLFKG